MCDFGFYRLWRADCGTLAYIMLALDTAIKKTMNLYIMYGFIFEGLALFCFTNKKKTKIIARRMNKYKFEDIQEYRY